MTVHAGVTASELAAEAARATAAEQTLQDQLDAFGTAATGTAAGTTLMFNGTTWVEVRLAYPTPASKWQGLPNGSTLLLVEGKEYAVPCPPITVSSTLTALGVEITTAGSTGALVRLGIRQDSSGVPGTLLRDAGTIDGTVLYTTTIGQKTGLTDALAVAPYWLIVAAQGAPVTPATVRAYTQQMPQIASTSVPANTSQAAYVESAATGVTTGAFVSSPPAYTVTGVGPRLFRKT